jgi:hypothetical protein
VTAHRGGKLGRLRGTLIGLLAAACGLLGACGHSAGSSGAPLVKRHSGPGEGGGSNRTANDLDTGPTDLVSAVSGGGEDGPVGLKFQLAQRPLAGQPVTITLRLVANQALDHLEARFHADDGLEVTQGSDFDPEGHLDAGATVDHNLTLVPGQGGIYTVMATVTAGSADAAVSRSFVIPIVVGATVAATRPK